MFLSKRRGVAVPHRKNTAEAVTVTMPAPSRIVLPMVQHLGAPCVPTVAVGDTVAVGQVVGDSEQFVSAPIHSGVSGTVAAIQKIRMPNGALVDAVIIDSDGENRLHPDVKPPVIQSRQDLLAAVRACGLVGLGGAGFPAHIKLNPKNLDQIDTLLINAAECEPYITADYRECIENTEVAVYGIGVIAELLGVKRVLVAIEDNKPLAIQRMRGALQGLSANYDAQVKQLPSRYPQGAEKVLIHACTGRRVPVGKLPADVGCVVVNITSAAVLAQYLQTGMPLITKRITVDGSAVAAPQNLRVTVGTPLSDVLEFVGVLQPPHKVLMGGPMMGIAQADTAMPVLKQNNAILALTEQDTEDAPATACIRCGKCAAACPMHLVPPVLVAAYKAADTDALKRRGILNCMECGCCSFSCPAHRPLVQTLRLAKTAVREKG